MNKKIVERNVDLAHVPPLTEKQKAEMAAAVGPRAPN
jgi:hypothetical protein